MQLELSQDDVGMKEEEEEEEEAGFGSGNGGGGGSGGPGSSSLSYHSTTSPSIAPRSMSSSFDEPLDEPFDSPMDEDEVVRRCSLDDSPRLFFVRSGGRNKQPYCASSTAMLNGSSVIANKSTSNRRRIKVGIRQLTGTQPQTTTTTILSYSFNLYCILFPTNRLETNESWLFSIGRWRVLHDGGKWSWKGASFKLMLLLAAKLHALKGNPPFSQWPAPFLFPFSLSRESGCTYSSLSLFYFFFFCFYLPVVSCRHFSPFPLCLLLFSSLIKGHWLSLSLCCCCCCCTSAVRPVWFSFSIKTLSVNPLGRVATGWRDDKK